MNTYSRSGRENTQISETHKDEGQLWKFDFHTTYWSEKA